MNEKEKHQVFNNDVINFIIKAAETTLNRYQRSELLLIDGFLPSLKKQAR